MPSSINGHVERSETSPPFLFSGRVRGGSVQLLDLKRRPLTAFGVTPQPSHFERSEKSPPFMFPWGSLEGVMSNPLN